MKKILLILAGVYVASKVFNRKTNIVEPPKQTNLLPTGEPNIRPSVKPTNLITPILFSDEQKPIDMPLSEPQEDFFF